MSVRIYVKISDDLDFKLSTYASKFGMSKSSFVAYALGKHISELDYQGEAFRTLSKAVADYAQQKGEPINETI